MLTFDRIAIELERVDILSFSVLNFLLPIASFISPNTQPEPSSGFGEAKLFEKWKPVSGEFARVA